MPICLNKALFKSFSSTPILLRIIYLSLLSVLSASSFNAKISALDIKNIIPKYIPINATNAPIPTLELTISILVFDRLVFNFI